MSPTDRWGAGPGGSTWTDEVTTSTVVDSVEEEERTNRAAAAICQGEEVTSFPPDLTTDLDAITPSGQYAFWGISEEPYKSLLLWTLISCLTLIAITLVTVVLSAFYAKYRESRTRQLTVITPANLPTHGSLRTMLATRTR